jgi:choline kinase
MSRAVRNVAKLRVRELDSKLLTIIIPAAGEGSRMKTYGPKSLINIAKNLTIIEYQISLLKDRFPHATIILVSGYESLKVMDKTPSGIVHIENINFSTTNNLKSVAIGLRASITNHVLIINGDLVFNNDAISYNFNTDSVVLIDDSNTMTDNEVGCTINNKYLENIMYELPNKWAQIAYFTADELRLLKKIAYNPLNEQLFMFEAINKIIDCGGKILAASPENIKVNDIDCSKDLEIAREFIL